MGLLTASIHGVELDNRSRQSPLQTRSLKELHGPRPYPEARPRPRQTPTCLRGPWPKSRATVGRLSGDEDWAGTLGFRVDESGTPSLSRLAGKWWSTLRSIQLPGKGPGAISPWVDRADQGGSFGPVHPCKKHLEADKMFVLVRRRVVRHSDMLHTGQRVGSQWTRPPGGSTPQATCACRECNLSGWRSPCIQDAHRKPVKREKFQRKSPLG